jgi:hypothetical protein
MDGLAGRDAGRGVVGPARAGVGEPANLITDGSIGVKESWPFVGTTGVGGTLSSASEK